MDWAQFPYRSTARVHNGPNAPLVTLQWYRTDLPFPPIDKEIVINSRIWWSDDVADVTVGELPVGENNYSQKTPNPPITRIPNGHMCHPEWLEVGEPWPNDLEPTEYDSEGIPVCCGGNRFKDAPEGGLELGDFATRNDATVGGVEIGREVPNILTFPDPPKGGVEIGRIFAGNDPTIGGVEIGREVPNILTFPDPPKGGVEIGGRGAEPPLWIDAPKGGVEIGGHISDARDHVDPAFGGVEIGGAAGDVFIPVNPYCLAYNAIGAGTFTRLPYPDDLTWVRFDGEYTLTAPSYTPFAGGPWLLFRASDGGRWSSITGWGGAGCFFFSQLHPPTVSPDTFNVCCAD